MRCERAVTPHGELYGVARSRGAALRRGRAAAGSRRCTHCAPQLISRAGAASKACRDVERERKGSSQRTHH